LGLNGGFETTSHFTLATTNHNHHNVFYSAKLKKINIKLIVSILILHVGIILAGCGCTDDEKQPETEKKLKVSEAMMEDKYKYKEIARDGSFIAYDNGVVYDSRTGLEWFAGPDESTNWKKARAWVDHLDAVDAAGGGWRMPTGNELQTLFKKGAGENNMSPLFKSRGWYIWSGETGKVKGSIWSRWEAVHFDFNFDGYISSELRWFSSLFRGFAVRKSRIDNLLAASYQCNLDTVKSLCDTGADANMKDPDGYTPLMMALLNRDHKVPQLLKQVEIIQLLIDRGAKVNAQQKDGHTAMYYAKKYDLAQVIKLLKQYDAK